ncbi:MAG: TlpA disulfide reductase family protein [Phycisphaerae bacterium]|jgi:thiol-disulfide isomerase/thioredoxin
MSVKASEPRTGPWRAWFDSPGGELPFGLELEKGERVWTAWITNGVERIRVPLTLWDGQELVLDIGYYDAKIAAKASRDGSRLDGEWIKKGRGDEWSKLPFHAKAGPARRFGRVATDTGLPIEQTVDGRWSVDFSGSDEPAVGIFERQPDDSIAGTFLTVGGDYGFLSGNLDGNRLRLSNFDGAHAFLFDARIQPDGTLKGDFWSRDTWHETWTAKRDARAKLPEAFGRSKWVGGTAFGDMFFPDLTGRFWSLDDPKWQGHPRIIEVFGTWCPNCHDETRYLVELDKKYHSRGLRIIGLAFELTGDFKRDGRQVQRYAKRHGVEYPLLVAGVATKEDVAKKLPVLDRIQAYPTTIFMDAAGKVRAIHSGFSGPATGAEYRRLQVEFEKLIEEMLSAKSTSTP